LGEGTDRRLAGRGEPCRCGSPYFLYGIMESPCKGHNSRIIMDFAKSDGCIPPEQGIGMGVQGFHGGLYLRRR
jgi:hypothetical protein